ncbi:MAG: hypothetical protein A2V58_00470 [Candidatus Muproteobacteria bacterium RBG_19FT_COMBO_61_10]|uniref:Uncharacterized protein n=1 Tax=Candidatus Muproteobacteria bacterium RBG_19FT_COMBO_61_10 TaxID=1817761 RepID=A0A1F6UK05_9PROT|nr:MAG: hypothetical protein A2V58_00470 [Candidatus Muproteobacteria bacterium RBG_19FT_COMBO_61_10]
MLQHRQPAALGVAQQRLVAHLVEVDFFVVLFLCVNDAAGVGWQGSEPIACFFMAAQKLRIQIHITRLAPGVHHRIVHVHAIVVSVERVGLGDAHSVRARPIQAHRERVLALRQFIVAGLRGVTTFVVGKGAFMPQQP